MKIANVLIVLVIISLMLSCSPVQQFSEIESEEKAISVSATATLQSESQYHDGANSQTEIVSQVDTKSLDEEEHGVSNSDLVETSPITLTPESNLGTNSNTEISTTPVLHEAQAEDAKNDVIQSNPFENQASSLGVNGKLIIRGNEGLMKYDLVDGSLDLLVEDSLRTVMLSPDASKIAYWVKTPQNIELWISDTHLWNPEQVMAVPLSDVQFGGHMRWLSNKFVILSIVELDGNAITRSIGSWIIDTDQRETLLEDSEHELDWGCFANPQPESNSLSITCPFFKWEDEAQASKTLSIINDEIDIVEQAIQRDALAFHQFAWSPSGQYLAVIPQPGATITIYDLTGNHLADYQAHEYFEVSTLKWSNMNHIAYSVFNTNVCVGHCISILRNEGRDWANIELPDQVYQMDAQHFVWNPEGDSLLIHDSSNTRTYVIKLEGDDVLVEEINGIEAYEISGWLP